MTASCVGVGYDSERTKKEWNALVKEKNYKVDPFETLNGEYMKFIAALITKRERKKKPCILCGD